MRAQFGRRVVVADDVDAADEGDARIDHHQLAVQAAQAMALEVEAPDLRPVVHGADAGRGEHGQEIGREIAGAEAIDRDIDQYAALGRLAQGAGDLVADFVIGEDVALKIDLGLRPPMAASSAGK
jgi:hypothetical protein